MINILLKIYLSTLVLCLPGLLIWVWSLDHMSRFAAFIEKKFPYLVWANAFIGVIGIFVYFLVKLWNGSWF